LKIGKACRDGFFTSEGRVVKMPRSLLFRKVGKYLPQLHANAFIGGTMILYIGAREAGRGAVLAEENEYKGKIDDSHTHGNRYIWPY
jgi:hypothetical protein